MAIGQASEGPALAVRGVRLAATRAGIRYPNRLDLVLIELGEGTQSAAVFTQNAFCAAPVTLARQHLREAQARYLLINTGNANAGTGAAGLQAASRCCEAVAAAVALDKRQVLPFSTGVIGEALPVDRLIAGLPACRENLAADNWEQAARGILTTDTRPKLASRRLQLAGQEVVISGMAKGAGMLRPNMATMLAFLFTDAEIPAASLETVLRRAVERSFNRITVDGDTSTNDACLLAATGEAGVAATEADLAEGGAFSTALQDLMQELATGLIRDAEGVSKFITVRVEEGGSVAECLKVAYCIAESPLVKTAFFASDPNWGRILAAVGRAGLTDLDIDAVSMRLGDVRLVAGGAIDPDYSEARGQAVMDQEEIEVTISLGRGQVSETVWTSDLSQDYVRINADYRS